MFLRGQALECTWEASTFKLGVRYYGMPQILEKQYGGSLNKTMDDMKKKNYISE